MPTTYGYCRVSTQAQKIERQVKNILSAAPDAVIIKEKYTGRTLARPAWQRLCTRLQPGDTIIFDSVSRMSRNAEEGWEEYKRLFDFGVELRFLKEPGIDTIVYREALTNTVTMTGTDADLILSGVNAFLLRLAERQLQLAFSQSQKEIDDLHQRQKEGIELRKQRGEPVGRQPGTTVITKKQRAAMKKIVEYNQTYGGNMSDTDTAQLCGISRPTLYRYKKLINEDMGAIEDGDKMADGN